MTFLASLLIVPFRSATHLDIELLKLPDAPVTFESHTATEAYERADQALAVMIEDALRELAGDDFDARVHTHWDWSPSKSRAVDIDLQLFSATVVIRLAALLTANYQDWKIHLNVLGNLGPDSKEVGAACLFRDRVLIEQSLCAFLAS